MVQREIELLAPAGSYEGFEAALGAGADAVYVGGAMFGARAYAKNFQQDELLCAIDTAHIHGKKLYLTVNTLLKNRELQGQLYEYLKPFYEAGLDAVIVQDFGVFSFIRENFPEMHLHASTQMAVTGAAGMKFLEEQGASRVVAARELSLGELSRMRSESSLELEAFVHGALCYSVSGQCLMSSIFGGRSGNRGRCAQPCRLPYDARLSGGEFKGMQEHCPLSLKDICTIDILPDIIAAGVTSLKIEGRMKQPNYTAGVTAVYRRYLDRFLAEGKDAYQVDERDKKYLLDLFNRGGSCRGYYEMHRGPSMMAFSNEKKTGEALAEIKKIKEKIHGNFILSPGSPAILEVSCGDTSAVACGGEVQYARTKPMERERILAQLEKLGNTQFQWETLDISMEGPIFVPVKVLNEVRRAAVKALEENLLEKSRRTAAQKQPAAEPRRNRKQSGPLPMYVSCENAETARALCDEPGIKGMYLPFDAMQSCLRPGLASGKEMYLALPHLMRGELPEDYIRQAGTWLAQGMKGFLVRNLEAYAALCKTGLGEKCVLDHSVYTWNDAATDFWRKQGVMRCTLPLELNEGEIRHRDNSGCEILVYGYLPLMVSAQCVRENLYGCNGCEETLFLRDRYNKEFPVSCHCRQWKMKNTEGADYCYNIIYNSIPYGLLGERDTVAGSGVSSIRLSFTVEKTEDALSLCRSFRDVYERKKSPRADYQFTKGHFKRGAE